MNMNGDSDTASVNSSTFSGVEGLHPARMILAPRTSYNRLGRLEAQGEAAGVRVPFSVRNPLGHGFAWSGGGAAAGGVLGALAGLVIHAIGAKQLNMPNSLAVAPMAFGGMAGAGVGAILGSISAWMQRYKGAKNVATAVKAKGLPSAEDARRVFEKKPEQARARLFTAFLGLGAHHRGRLGAYEEMLGGQPAEKVSVIPDVLNYTPVAGYSHPGAWILDMIRAEQAEDRLSRARSKAV